MRTDHYVYKDGQITKVAPMVFPNNGTSVIMAPIEVREDERITYSISLIQQEWDYTFCIWIIIDTIPGYHAMIWFPTFTDLRDYMIRYLPPKKTGVFAWIANQIVRIRLSIAPPPKQIDFSTEETR
jgi:hypothetical protein